MPFTVSFKTCVSLLIFCFDDLSIGVSGVLKSPTIIVFQFLLLCLLASVLWIEVLLCWVHRYLQLLCLLLGLIPWSLCSVLPYILQYSLRSIFSDMRIVTSAYFIYLFFASHLHGIYFFLSSHFQSICFFRSELGVL